MPALASPTLVRQERSLARASDTASATDAAATITIPGVPGIAHSIGGVAWSYAGSGTLSGGRLTILDGSTVVFDLDITAKGQDALGWNKYVSPGSDLVVTLADGGENVTGKISILGYTALPGVGSGQGGALDFSDYLQSGLLGIVL